ncbi:MAG: ABC transporter permease [Syntrophomonadaceae bacterium]|jgi:ABC-2 type transport system permease protein
MKRIVMNPVLDKELRSRMRTWKSPLLISLYMGALALITLGYYWTQQHRAYYSGFGPEVGPQIYVTLTIFQLMLVAFITPAFTAGVISGEREKQTLDLLICTRLSAASIILNKLLSSIAYILLLIVASLPFFAVVFFFGGILLSEIFQVFTVYLMTALTFGAIGVFCSTIFRKTQVSVVVTYVIVFFFLAGNAAIAAFLSQVYPNFDGLPFITYLNPVVALYSTFPSSFGQGMSIFFGISSSRMGVGTTALGLEPWQYNFIGDAIIILLFLVLAIIILDPVARFSRIKRLRIKKAQNAAESAINGRW